MRSSKNVQCFAMEKKSLSRDVLEEKADGVIRIVNYFTIVLCLATGPMVKCQFCLARCILLQYRFARRHWGYGKHDMFALPKSVCSITFSTKISIIFERPHSLQHIYGRSIHHVCKSRVRQEPTTNTRDSVLNWERHP